MSCTIANCINTLTPVAKLNLDETLVIGISSRALFDLEKENDIFEKEGLEAYQKYQIDNENEVLGKGTAFHLIESLLNLNKANSEKQLIEVVVMSKNSPDTGLRVLYSINHYGLPITRSVFTSSVSLAKYVEDYNVALFLSKSESDIQEMIDSGKCAAALIYPHPKGYEPDVRTLRVAFDVDAVIVSDDSEVIYKTDGLEAFQQNESEQADVPLKEGPFAKFIKILSKLEAEIGQDLIRIALVTARDYPANVRLIKTLRNWGVYVDEAFFLGGIPKDKVLKSFNPHIFFDDQETHVEPASSLVPASRVPYKSSSLLHPTNKEQLMLAKKEIEKMAT